jgi:nitrilase
VVFPESCIPAFPIWSSVLPLTDNHGFFECLAKESTYIDGEEMLAIRDAAKKSGTIVSVGILGKARYSTATLFNSNIIIGSDGTVLVHHRKLMPTFFKKLTWAAGDWYGLRVADTRFGKIGGLICRENTNSLARYLLMAQREQIHISTWPAAWPTSALSLRLEDPKPRRNYDNVTANKTRAAAHCFENKCFGILCAGFFDGSAKKAITSTSAQLKYMADVFEHTQRAATMFLDPRGITIWGYTVDSVTGRKDNEREFLQGEEGIFYAELDLDMCLEGKQYRDVVGEYQRLDVFDLKVNRTRRKPVAFVEAVESPSSSSE